MNIVIRASMELVMDLKHLTIRRKTKSITGMNNLENNIGELKTQSLFPKMNSSYMQNTFIDSGKQTASRENFRYANDVFEAVTY